MVAAISGGAGSNSNLNNPKLDANFGSGGNPRTRPPMEVGESGNGQRRLRSRSVSSRYLSSSTTTSTSNSSTSTTTTLTTTTTTSSSSSSSSRRYVSPLVARSGNAAATGPKRSQSVDRRRAVAARPATAAPDARLSNAVEQLGGSVASRLLFTSSRSLSVSFQGEAFSLPISKAKPAPANVSSARKGTPDRRRGTPVRGKSEALGGDHQVEHRWPARTRSVNTLSRSIDYSAIGHRANGSNGSNGPISLVKDSERNQIDERRGDWFHRRLSMDFGDARVCDTNSAQQSSMPSDLTASTASDTDSVSSGSTSGLQESNSGLSTSTQLRCGPRGALVSAKFWQETNSRMRRLQDPSSPLPISPIARMLGPPKCFQAKRLSADNPIISPRATTSPIRGPPRSASPSKFMMTSISYPSRGNCSPSRSDGANGAYSNASSNGPSILSFSADLRRGKMADNLVVNAHLLRLLYNRHLQWRFVNAQSDATVLMQSRTAEKMLWNAWITISELRRSVTIKRSKLNMLRKRLKLTSILRGQLPYLEEWFLQDAEHLSSILGATEALKASILRLPITGKAVADIQNIKDAVRSAVDVMQAMMSSLFSLLPKIEEMNLLVAELKNTTAKEEALLAQCKGLVSVVAALQVRDCSMRTHILQVNSDITAGGGNLRADV
uniref:QWRF motif-containing protein 2 n=1 Tax=Kalanchoe fedtschenkoi TaxID=63787 RepID=A0A7N0ZXS2_KALFE